MTGEIVTGSSVAANNVVPIMPRGGANDLALVPGDPLDAERGRVTEAMQHLPPGRQFTDLAAALASVGRARPWLFEGAVEGTPISVLAGPEKTSKSWALMQAAVACATGGAWMGAFPCKKPGAVFYLDSEYGDHEFARRLARLSRGMGHDPNDVRAMVAHYYSRDLRLVHNDEAAKWMLAAVQLVRPRLIIVDPWRNHLPGDENSTQDTINAFNICAQMRDATGAIVLIAHHLNKAGSISGARALTTRADLLIEGTDSEVRPVYTARGRTIRRDDAIVRPFGIEVDHDDDHDDTIAKTRVRLRFEGESHPANGSLSVPALRVLEQLRAKHTAMSGSAVRKATGISGTDLTAVVKQLSEAGLAFRRSNGSIELGTSEFFSSLDPER